MYEVIDIENLAEWRGHNSDAKHITVRHGKDGLVEYTFNYKKPEDVTFIDSLGMFDAFGNFYFIDSEGTLHVCLSNRRFKLKQ